MKIESDLFSIEEVFIESDSELRIEQYVAINLRSSS